jgi:hypothetical protein
MAGFLKAVGEARKVLEAQGVRLPTEVDDKAAIKDLELQWQDHFHMRDQTWKTLNNSALIFIGAVGADIYRGIPVVVMMAAYSAVAAVSVVGFFVAMHHRYIQQKIKFPIIVRYEVMLGLTPVFEDILEKRSVKGISTSSFIVVSHAALVLIALLLVGFKIYEGMTFGFFTRAAD